MSSSEQPVSDESEIQGISESSWKRVFQRCSWCGLGCTPPKTPALDNVGNEGSSTSVDADLGLEVLGPIDLVIAKGGEGLVHVTGFGTE